MTEHRRFLTATGLALLLVTAGCSLLTQQQTTIRATDVAVANPARSDAGYSQARDTTQRLNRTVSVAGQERTVTVVNHVAEYKRRVEVGPVVTGELARFTVMATPQVSIAGRAFNPVGDMSNAELARMLQSEYETIENVRLVGNRTETVLGEPTTVSKFSAEARTVAGQTVDVSIHIAKVRHGEDFVVAVAIYPQRLEGEQANVNRLLGGIEHPPGA